VGHDHSHHHHHGHDHHHGTENISAAFFINTAFSILELVGGFYFSSMAVLSNALHDLGDSFSLASAYYFQRKAQGKRTDTYTYGYRRFSLLGALINSMILIGGSALILSEAIHRIAKPEQASAKGMLLFAVLGIGVNLAAMLRLRKGDSLNERVVSLHFLQDTLGWVAVLIASVIMMYKNIPLLDPILSIGIALFILYNVYQSMRSLFQIILQGTPLNVSEKDIRETITSVAGVKDIHDVHLWSLDGKVNILTMHVVIGQGASTDEAELIKKKIKHDLGHINIQHATIEIEPENVNCEQEHTNHESIF
jgi:cobalt-zinc-cadmium efflux system protein